MPRATATRSTSGSSARSCAAATAGACPPAARRGSASAPTTRASTSAGPPTRSPRALQAPAVRYQGNWFPHRLRAADRRRRPLRGRQRRALLPALGRGHPDRVLLRDRGRARAAGRAGRRARPVSGRSPTTPPSTSPRARLPPRAAPAAPGPGAAAARADGRSCGPSRRQPLVDRAFGWYLEQAHPRLRRTVLTQSQAWRSPTTSAGSSRSSSRTGARARC